MSLGMGHRQGLSGIGDPLGLAGGVSVVPPTVSSAANSNLLRWTDDLTNIVWIKTLVVVADRGGNPTADLVQDQSTLSAVRQISTVAAAVGAGATTDIFDVDTASTRYSVSAIFDGLPYTFSVYLEGQESGIGYRLRIDRFGGFIRCSMEDIGDVGSNYIGRAQLEQAASPSVYSTRTV